MNPIGQRGFAGCWGAALAAVGVIAVYAVIAGTADSELGSRTGAEAYYNRLVDGFDRGQLSLDLAPPAGLVALPDPYDPRANAPFHGQMYSPGRIHDLSYYRGKLYLYFSVIPAAVLFLPFHWLTGSYLSHQLACLAFCTVGFLAAAALVDSIRRHCFPRAGPGTGAIATLAVGLVPLVPIVLQRPDVWEVPVTAAFAFWMVALLLVWAHLRRPAPSPTRALGIGLAAALAIGGRPNECGGAFVAAVVLAGVRSSGAGRARLRATALALAAPLAAVALALLAYNYARFGNVLEFGQRYQLSGERVAEGAIRHFDPAFLGYNLRLYFLDYPGWRAAFPFVRDPVLSPGPPGYGFVENPAGALTLLPFILCAAAVPAARRRGPVEARRALDAILAAGAILFVAGAAPLCLYFTSAVRYQLEFIPALVLLATIGFLGLADGLRAAPWAGRALLGAAVAAAALSIAFNGLMAANLRAEVDARRGAIATQAGRLDEAAGFFRRALRLAPANAFAQLGLAEALARESQFAAAAVEFKKAIALVPDSPIPHYNYGYCLFELGRLDEAAAECAAALRLQPDFTAARTAAEAIRRAQGRLP